MKHNHKWKYIGLDTGMGRDIFWCTLCGVIKLKPFPIWNKKPHYLNPKNK